MKNPVARWTVFTILLVALSILGLIGAALYSDEHFTAAAPKKTVSADSCPSPGVDYATKERKTMTTAVRKEMIPLIDSALPAKTETATFGLG